MARKLIAEGVYAVDPDALFSAALEISDMKNAMSGFATYDGGEDGTFREGQTYTYDITILGFIKNSAHNIYVKTADREKRLFETLESSKGSGIKRWDHRLTVFESQSGAVWRDEVIIDAGWQSFAVLRLARKMYQYRHNSRGALSVTTKFESV